MGCIHQQFGSSKCSLFNEIIERPGCTEEGICICSDDENPYDSCEDYDSGDADDNDYMDEEDDEDFFEEDEDDDCCGDCCNDTKEHDIGGNDE